RFDCDWSSDVCTSDLCEPPGEYGTVLRERGATLHRVDLDEGQPLPALTGFDAIVAMGGPMSANDDAELPCLAAEKAAIGEAVRRSEERRVGKECRARS